MIIDRVATADDAINDTLEWIVAASHGSEVSKEKKRQ